MNQFATSEETKMTVASALLVGGVAGEEEEDAKAVCKSAERKWSEPIWAAGIRRETGTMNSAMRLAGQAVANRLMMISTAAAALLMAVAAVAGKVAAAGKVAVASR